MQNIKLSLFILMFFGLANFGNAQNLFQGSNDFTTKKVVYMTLQDGTQLQSFASQIEKKDGIIKSITIKDNKGADKIYRPHEILNVYLPVNTPLSNKMDGTWDSKNFFKHLFTEGYVYFELSEVDMRGKTRPMLLQLLNPSFSSKIKIYLNPWLSDESVSNGNMNNKEAVARTSFYVKHGSFPAFKLDASAYSDNFIALCGACERMIPKKQIAQWSNFSQDVFEYNRCK